MATNHQSQSRISWSKKYPRNPVDWLEKMLKSNRWFQESQFLLPSMSLKPDENEHVQSKVPRHETSQRTGKRWPVEERSADVVRKAISTILKNTCRTKATGKIVGNTAGSYFIPTLFIFLSQISNLFLLSPSSSPNDRTMQGRKTSSKNHLQNKGHSMNILAPRGSINQSTRQKVRKENLPTSSKIVLKRFVKRFKMARTEDLKTERAR